MSPLKDRVPANLSPQTPSWKIARQPTCHRRQLPGRSTSGAACRPWKIERRPTCRRKHLPGRSLASQLVIADSFQEGRLQEQLVAPGRSRAGQLVAANIFQEGQLQGQRVAASTFLEDRAPANLSSQTASRKVNFRTSVSPQAPSWKIARRPTCRRRQLPGRSTQGSCQPLSRAPANLSPQTPSWKITRHPPAPDRSTAAASSPSSAA